jgi:hypothetical protein
MKSNTGQTSGGHRPRRHERGGVRSVLKWAVIGLMMLCLAGLAWHFFPSATAPSDIRTIAIETSAVADHADPSAAPKLAEVSPAATVIDQPAPATQPSDAPAAVAVSAPVVPLQQFTPSWPVDPAAMANRVAELKRLSGTNVNLTVESLSDWRTNFMQLVQSGAAALPAIQALLEQRGDAPFSKEVSDALGYGSVRLAALDALRQIGGPEAAALLGKTLGQTTDPREIAVLARNLEEIAPGQYLDQALAAVRSALQTAVSAKDPQMDVAPLFEVLQRYGGASVISELEKATGQWKYYAVTALANLPEGAGIPALLKMADPSTGSGNRLLALETVAQMAAVNPTMADFLVSQVTGKQIPANYWPYLSGPLTGDQYFPVDSVITKFPTLQSWSDLKTTHIPYGNQNLYSVPGELSLTPDVINQRIVLVDQLLSLTSDPTAVRTLQQARGTLQNRLARAVASQLQAQTVTGVP